MGKRKQMTLKFYQNLGKLFYAIAAVDKNVEAVEFAKLKELVKKQWLNLDTIEDTFGSDAAFQIEIVFDWLNTQGNLNAKSCFDDFIAYKNKQNHLFTDTVKHLILKTAHAIAASFSGINKSELIFLANLDRELKNT
jgi:hypothetical protein